MAKAGWAAGGAGGGAGGSTTGDAVNAANQSQSATVVTLKLKGEVVGEFVNAPVLPGTTFGWGPSGTGLIAFAVNGAGRLVLMDGQGRKQEIDGSKAVVLPGWTQTARASCTWSGPAGRSSRCGRSTSRYPHHELELRDPPARRRRLPLPRTAGGMRLRRPRRPSRQGQTAPPPAFRLSTTLSRLTRRSPTRTAIRRRPDPERLRTARRRGAAADPGAVPRQRCRR